MRAAISALTHIAADTVVHVPDQVIHFTKDFLLFIWYSTNIMYLEILCVSLLPHHVKTTEIIVMNFIMIARDLD